MLLCCGEVRGEVPDRHAMEAAVEAFHVIKASLGRGGVGLAGEEESGCEFPSEYSDCCPSAGSVQDSADPPRSILKRRGGGGVVLPPALLAELRKVEGGSGSRPPDSGFNSEQASSCLASEGPSGACNSEGPSAVFGSELGSNYLGSHSHSHEACLPKI